MESDLIDRAARIADAKAAVLRRIETSGTFSPGEASSAVSAMARGHGPSGDEQGALLSLKARLKAKTQESPSTFPANIRKQKPKRVEPVNREKKKPYRAKINRQKEVESLTPHFSGFRFAHQTDADWLGLNEKERVSFLGTVCAFGC